MAEKQFHSETGQKASVVDLGYMNGWGEEYPSIYLSCRKLEHPIHRKNIGRCLNSYHCPICNYYYTVDSSD